MVDFTHYKDIPNRVWNIRGGTLGKLYGKKFDLKNHPRWDLLIFDVTKYGRDSKGLLYTVEFLYVPPDVLHLLKQEEALKTRKDVVLIKEEKDNNVIPFEKPTTKLIMLPGGSEPPKDENWLEDLDIGSVFLARHKQDKDMLLLEYHVEFKTPNTTRLTVMANNNKVESWVDTLRFSRNMERVELLQEIKNEKQ